MEGSRGVDRPLTRTILGKSIHRIPRVDGQLTLAHQELVLGPRGVREDVVCLYHWHGAAGGEAVLPRRVSWWGWEDTGGVVSQPLMVAMAKASSKLLLLPFSTSFFVFLTTWWSWVAASSTAWPAGVRWTWNALELVGRVPQGVTGCQDR